MKRYCFDTESNYYKHPASGVGSVEVHREYWRDKKLRFDCAVLFGELTGEFHEFRRHQAEELVAMLARADELISHSGPRVDLIVLEHSCGEDRVAPLRQIKHHDLFEMGQWSSLDTLAKRYASDRIPSWERDRQTRLKLAREQGDASGVEGKLAKARFDVERTCAVFLALSSAAVKNVR